MTNVTEERVPATMENKDSGPEIIDHHHHHDLDGDVSPTVCYCYNKTKDDVLSGVAECGSLEAYQKKSKVGLGCGGCRLFLSALTGESGADITQQEGTYDPTTVCVNPGSRIMTGFIIKAGNLHSKIRSINATVPQFKDCDMTGVFDYMLLNAQGQQVFYETKELKTNEMFSFDVRDLDLPDPFCGMFLFGLPRHNYGASRFNIQWTNEKSTTSTHENYSTGRPRVFLPVLYTKDMLDGSNDTYIGQINPHNRPIHFTVAVFDVRSRDCMVWRSTIPAYGTNWICASKKFIRPALEAFGGGTAALRIETIGADASSAVTNYYFFHNRKTDTWSAQHL